MKWARLKKSAHTVSGVSLCGSALARRPTARTRYAKNHEPGDAPEADAGAVRRCADATQPRPHRRSLHRSPRCRPFRFRSPAIAVVARARRVPPPPGRRSGADDDAVLINRARQVHAVGHVADVLKARPIRRSLKDEVLGHRRMRDVAPHPADPDGGAGHPGEEGGDVVASEPGRPSRSLRRRRPGSPREGSPRPRPLEPQGPLKPPL